MRPANPLGELPIGDLFETLLPDLTADIWGWLADELVANGDFHLDPNDTIAQGKGVDISGITDHDYDGDTRDSSTKTAGADVP